MSAMEARRGSKGGRCWLHVHAECLLLPLRALLKKDAELPPPQGFRMAYAISKWYQPPQKHTTNHQAGCMQSWSRILVITLRVSVSRSIVTTEGYCLGETREVQVHKGKRDKTQPQGHGPNETHTHTHEDGGMKVRSLGNMQRGDQAPQSHSSRQHISQYKCSTHVRQLDGVQAGPQLLVLLLPPSDC